MPLSVRGDNARIAPVRNHIQGGHILETPQIPSAHRTAAAFPAPQAVIEIRHSDVQQVDKVVFAQVYGAGIQSAHRCWRSVPATLQSLLFKFPSDA